MKRCPSIYTPLELTQWQTGEEYETGRYRPSRPMGFVGIGFMKRRLSISWRVFTGRYDALDWEGDTNTEGEK